MTHNNKKLNKVITGLSLTLPILGSLISTNVFAKVTTSCSEEKLPSAYSYCITKDDKSTNPDYLYFFHGKGGNAKSWSKEGKGIMNQWGRQGIQMPTVISISFPGKYWILTNKYSGRASSGLYEVFRNSVVPKIESKIGAPQGRRLGYGISMGGVNVLSAMTKDQNLFDKVAAICPVIPEYSPFDYLKALTYLTKGASKDTLQEVILMGTTLFPNTQAWQNEYPTYVVKKSFNANSPELYVSTGNKDKYGIFQDSKKLVDAAIAQGTRAQWEPLNGGHCVFNHEAIARFLGE